MRIRVNMEILIACVKVPTLFRPSEEITFFFLKNSDGTYLLGKPVNDRMLKHYFPPQ
jgi:hypothetical protein